MKNIILGFKFRALLLACSLFLGVSITYAQSVLQNNTTTLVPTQGVTRAQTLYTAEIERLSKADEAGQVTVKKGDAISRIAKHYGQVNDIPFELALKGLVLANPQAFVDTKHNLSVGAALLLPRKDDVLNAAKTGTFNATPAPVVAVDPIVAAPISEPVVPAADNVKQNSIEVTTPSPEPASTANPPKVDTITDTQTTVLEAFRNLEVWAWCLLAILGLMILVGLSKWSRKKTNVEHDEEDMAYHKNDAPKIILNSVFPRVETIEIGASTEPTVIPNVTVEESAVTSGAEPAVISSVISTNMRSYPLNHEIDDDQESSSPKVDLEHQKLSTNTNVLVDDERLHHMPLDTFVSDARFNQALRGLSADSLDLTLLNRTASVETLNEDNVSQLSSVETVNEVEVVSDEVKSKAGQTYELQQGGFSRGHFISNGFFKQHLRTQIQQWQDLGLNAKFATTTVIQAEARAAIQVPAEVLEQNKMSNPELDVDMSKFLHEFSHRLPEPSLSSVDYEDLLDRARLQAWLNVHSIDEILLYAQDAYDARYDDVAQLMLNDVLLRGDAKQCAAVLTLRHMWSYPQGVF